MMLLGLTIASGALAGTRMAAWWVIVPPSVMLVGYLLLLREAAKADAERRETARHRDRMAAARVAAPTGAPRSAPVAPGTLGAAGAAEAAEAAEAKVINIPAAPQEIYDQYADAKLRAVGD